MHNDYYDNIIHYDYNEVKKLSHFRPTQALDNVTNNKVVMAEAREAVAMAGAPEAAVMGMAAVAGFQLVEAATERAAR